MLMKLTPFVNFINFLWAAFVPIFFCQKNYKAKIKLKKSMLSTFAQKSSSKMLMKLTPDWFEIESSRFVLEGECWPHVRVPRDGCWPG